MIRELLASSDRDDLIETAVLLVSEVVTTAVSRPTYLSASPRPNTIAALPSKSSSSSTCTPLNSSGSVWPNLLTTVTEAASEGNFTIVPSNTGGRRSFIIDVVDGSELIRTYIPQGEVTEVGSDPDAVLERRRASGE